MLLLKHEPFILLSNLNVAQREPGSYSCIATMSIEQVSCPQHSFTDDGSAASHTLFFLLG